MGTSEQDTDAWALGALVLVAGKGGSGKTTVATALGVALSRTRRCLVLSADRGSLSRLAGLPLARDVVEVDWAPGLWVGGLDPWKALEDFGVMRLGNSRIVKALVRSRSVRGLVEALPGLTGLALLGRAWHYCRASSSAGRFDTVIMDVSGRGHLGRLLRQPGKLGAILPSGPLRRDLEELAGVLSNASRSKIVVVTIPENYSVSETIELAREVALVHRRIDLVVANALWPAWLEDCGSDWEPSGSTNERMDRIRRFAALRVEAQRAALDLLGDTGSLVVEVPFVNPLWSAKRRLTEIADSLQLAFRRI